MFGRVERLWQMNGCFGTSALNTSEDNFNLQLYTDFSRSNDYGQSGNGPESESDVTSLCTGRQLQLLILYHQKAFNMRNLRRSEIKDTERKKTVIW